MQPKTENLPWNLQIKAQANHFGFNFKLRFNKTPEFLLNLKPHRLSLLFKLRKWRLQLQSHSGSTSMKTGSIKSKLSRIFEKIRSRLRIKKRYSLTEKSAVIDIGKSRLVKCGALSIVLAMAVVVSSAFGFDATEFIQTAMEAFPAAMPRLQQVF